MKALRPFAALAAFTLAATILAACADLDSPTGEPSFYRSLAQKGVQVDAVTAASMISGYRRNNGVGPVKVDPALNRLAEQQAYAMARSDKLDHNAGGSFGMRMKASGYSYKAAAENIGVGYYTLAEAFSGWRDSPHHRANMLLKDVTRIGIAAVYRADTKYKVFWSLILAGPADEVGPTASGSPPAYLPTR